MRIDNNKNTPNFGWNCFTHKAITTHALKNLPELKKYKRILQNYCQAPDFDDTRFLGDNHCYYKSSQNDYKNGKPSAKSFYAKYIKEARTASLQGNKKLTAKCMGRALHFLQDMALTLHTKPKPTGRLEKKADERMHFKFESLTFLKQNIYRKNYKKPQISDKTFNKLFMDNVEYSTKGQQVEKNNTSSWGLIAQGGINHAIATTTAFLQKMEYLLK